MASGEIKGWIHSITLHPELSIVLATWWGTAIKIGFDDKLYPDVIKQAANRKGKVIVEADDHSMVDKLDSPMMCLRSIRSE